MNYEDTINYLYSQLPIFQRVGAPAYKADLKNTIEICNRLNNPQNKLKSIHIAGTNGKGSVSNMVASILQDAGYKVGLHNSPHLVDLRERMKINGKMPDKRFVINFVKKYKNLFVDISPSFFELTFAMTMYLFAKQKVDFAIIETGMGGRLDSTNIITPFITAITNISKDHTQFLGNTIEKIAIEKAGIIKNKIPIVIGESHADTKEIFIKIARQKKSPLSFADKLYDLVTYESTFENLNIVYKNTLNGEIVTITSPLVGLYQINNIKTVLEISRLLISNNIIKPNNVINGIKNTLINTYFKGRWQVINKKPLTICDIGHNEDGIKSIVNQINSINYNNLHIVLGVVNDKDIDSILDLLPKNAKYYFCKPNIPRGLDVNILKNKAESYNLSGESYNSVKTAYCYARSLALENDLIFIGGSAFVVAEIIE